ncbi:ABC transporter permease [Xanthobacter autotrophicus]|uniref:ABC transporter permease n=1 Tax=Xanthobacter autotrophicus TaxID=280 RepID=UPI0037285EDB
MTSVAAKSPVKMHPSLHVAGTPGEGARPRPPAGAILLRPERPVQGTTPVPDRSKAGLVRRWLKLNMQAIRATALGALAIGLFILAWHVVTVNRMDLYVRFLNVPSPEQVLESARTAFSTSAFFDHIVMSCRRIFLGFALAALVAVPLGLLMGRFALLKEFVFPVCEVLRPIPAIAWVPMAIMLWPTNEQSIVFITFLGAFFPILLNTLHGMANVDEVLVRAARCLGASERATFREVYFPAVLPQVFTGLTVGMGVAWVSLIAAEMISGQFGIGYFTWEAYSLVQYPDIALGMITIGVLGLASSFLIRLVGRAVTPWSRAK